MRPNSIIAPFTGLLVAGASATTQTVTPLKPVWPSKSHKEWRIDLGPRPGFLVDDMDEGPLKNKLGQCLNDPTPLRSSPWVVAHRGGGTLFMPEHSMQSLMTGVRTGAGVLECDVSFTQDRELVCRHSQCDLHFTTDILQRPELAAKCSEPFTPARDGKDASAKCCTSDITVAEFKTLCANMEGENTNATTIEEYHPSTPNWRTDLYATCGETITLEEHIETVKSLGLLHTPELKTPEIPMPFQGNYTQKIYAQQLIDTYRKHEVPADQVYPQSFLYDDILYWMANEPEYARQALFLDSYGDTAETFPAAVSNLTNYAADGLNYIAPPIVYLVTAKDGKMVPSEYAIEAKKLGLKILPWTMERSGPLAFVKDNGDYYYQYFADAVHKDGDMYTLIDLMYRKIGIVGLFSDWTATLSFYANCMGIFDKP
ncbi:glycerophosphoryl diester phosphodiesterase [Geosmithia morbida]|uniref:glycerophosphodiester phosphodiesterase n=1 Tax=Geosmithia morbida TaxID=1094350 RepID=A0A9P4YNV2_9HYPO|nr:glycerophosphoryl diester phosphodiesterase [Geosmithia morbida]KAF4120396.1 glycerophosphoryl diester phosphodiesterase [Geosmithia morbida]